VNTDLFLAFLTLLEKRAKRAGRVIILVLDNARYFRKAHRAKSKLESISSRVVVFWLPKYSSEKLNRIENIWDHLKNGYFSRMLVERREKFLTEIIKFLKRLCRKGELGKLFGSNLPT
jgi:transposase